jgi:DNA-directed RNA polymerase subunit RPC12/RpoP
MGGVKMNKYEIEVKENNKLPHFSDPGSYPIFYIDKNNSILCSDCAAKNAKDIVNHEIHWEGYSYFCNDCNEEIESAYGDPEENK